jgi:hypothetical protein
LHYLDVLELNSNCLFGSLPSQIGLLTNIQKLNLEDNGINGFVPDELFNMSSLTHLNLAWQYENERNCTTSKGDVLELFITSTGKPNEGLEGKVLEKIYRLRHLKEILVEDNYFSGTISPEIKNLKHLGEQITAK